MKNLTNKFKRFIVLLVLMSPVAWCGATIIHSTDGYSVIQIKERSVQSTPKGSTIQASIDGHYLTVTFTQAIGYMTMELNQVPE